VGKATGSRLWYIQSLSKSATADFDERAFAHPTCARFGGGRG
jgi:hypothetical protein